jgi:RHS repeat-associated protein
MRVDIVGGANTLYYSLKDHLGSASVLLDSSGNLVANGEQRYYPFGENRITSADLKTDHLFTGQLSVGLGGIYHYGARFYSSKLGRFLSADTIVPDYANPQSLNRFAYVYNNPLKYVDPTGHEPQYCDNNKDLEIGRSISQADCWAYERDKYQLGVKDLEAPQPGEGYQSPVAWYAIFELTPEELLEIGIEMKNLAANTGATAFGLGAFSLIPGFGPAGYIVGGFFGWAAYDLANVSDYMIDVATTLIAKAKETGRKETVRAAYYQLFDGIGGRVGFETMFYIEGTLRVEGFTNPLLTAAIWDGLSTYVIQGSYRHPDLSTECQLCVTSRP